MKFYPLEFSTVLFSPRFPEVLEPSNELDHGLLSMYHVVTGTDVHRLVCLFLFTNNCRVCVCVCVCV